MRELSYCRRQILAALAAGERTGTDLAAELFRTQSNVCRDLMILRRDGLVTSRRDDTRTRVLYRLARTGDDE